MGIASQKVQAVCAWLGAGMGRQDALGSGHEESWGWGSHLKSLFQLEKGHDGKVIVW